MCFNITLQIVIHKEDLLQRTVVPCPFDELHVAPQRTLGDDVGPNVPASLVNRKVVCHPLNRLQPTASGSLRITRNESVRRLYAGWHSPGLTKYLKVIPSWIVDVETILDAPYKYSADTGH